jgi:hypothetical protein
MKKKNKRYLHILKKELPLQSGYILENNFKIRAISSKRNLELKAQAEFSKLKYGTPAAVLIKPDSIICRIEKHKRVYYTNVGLYYTPENYAKLTAR